MPGILPRAQTFASQLGSNLGAGLGKGLSQSAEMGIKAAQQNRENKNLSEKFGIDLAGIRDPYTRQQVIGEMLRRGTAKSAAESTIPPELRGSQTGSAEDLKGLGIGSEDTRGARTQPLQQTQRTNAPGQIDYTKSQLLSPEEQRIEAAELSRRSLGTANPIDFNTALSQVDAQEQRKLRYQTIQKDYRAASDAAMSKVFGNNVDPELLDVAAQEAEKTGATYATSADRDREATKIASDLKNLVSTAEKNIKPNTLPNKIKESFKGTDRSQEEKDKSIKNQIDPLLKKGLYDEARRILKVKGYHPEKVESLISNLSEPANRELNKLPPLRIEKPKTFTEELEGRFGVQLENHPEYREEFKNNIESILKQDPATNLILLRKAYADKNIGWRDFKSVLDDLISEGKFTPERDQKNAVNDTLNEPPLDKLDKILNKFGLLGI